MPNSPMTMNQRRRASGLVPHETDRRPSASERGYGLDWRIARKWFLSEHPLCRHCLDAKPQRLTPATVVDHIKPHKGVMALFWDADNWQALCNRCHGIKTAKEDGAFGNRRK